MKTKLIISSLFMATAILCGAFGAHGLVDQVTPERLSTFETGALYHLLHGIGLMSLLALSQQFPRLLGWPFRLIVAGTLIFSGSLYLLVLLDQPGLGAITPVGGVLLVLGWIAVPINLSR